ncbi:MAG: PQQ-binding-like beta-propeller repeat protein [Hydrotalea sp.]|nr:PQQ-binding-like beta-propeller repeat protein [Hydrotalea sp.]
MTHRASPRFLFGLALASGLLLTACTDDKLTLTGKRQDIDIASIDDYRATDSKLVGGGYGLTAPVTNNEWRSSGGGNDRRPPHARGGEQGKVVFYIKVGTGTGYATPYPVRVRGDERPQSPRGQANVANISPIVADNKIFTIDSSYRITAFDWQNPGDTPRVKWLNALTDTNNYNYGNGGGMTFATGGGKDGKTPLLIVTTGFGRVVGLNANTGDKVFEQDVILPIRNAAAVTNGLAIVKTIDGSVYGLSLRDGRKVWQNSALAGNGETVESIGFKNGGSAPTASAGRVWIGYFSGNVAALNAAGGGTLWQDGTMKFTVGDNNRYREIVGNMVLDGGVIYAFSFGGDAIAFRADNGNKLWRKKLATTDNPTVNGQTIFIIDADYNLKAINKATGNLFWNRIIDKYQFPGTRNLTLLDWHGPLLVSRRLFLTNNIGDYMFVNALNGNMLAQGQDDIYKTDAAPIAAKNTILFVNQMGYLVGIQ